MGLSASRAAFVLALGGALYASLRPQQRIERALDLALLPARALAELTAPLSWLQLRSIRAAESALDERENAEYAARLEFDAAERRAALPTSPELAAGRRFVHATVVGRRPEHFDQIVIEPDGRDATGLEIGMPVTTGDVYVGRIDEFDPLEPGRAFVKLLTASSFTVGAVLDAGAGKEPIHFVAGGVVKDKRRGRSAEIAIDVHNPSSRSLPSALARVDESFAVLERFGAQARGFELGTLEQRGGDTWIIRPRLDYKAGLFQVVVACPPDVARADDREVEDVLFDGRWREVRAISRGEPRHAREGLKLAAGTWNGASAGAAVVAGVRLVGVVARVAPLSCDVRTLGDPGLALPVVAHVEGLERPLALGRLVALGRTPSGELAFAWDAVVSFDEREGSPARHASLFTASGAPLVPRGLLIGECDLPSGSGLHTLSVKQEVDARALRSLWLRTAEPAP